MADLDTLQRWMQAVIMHPGGAEQGLVSPDATRAIAPAGRSLESLVNPSSAMTSLERLEIYAGAYYARLLECLRAEFPMTAKAVGEEVFDEFAVGYLQRYPSTSYTLCRLGASFPRYLAETRPEEEGDWPGLIIDLARLEWDFSEVFDGPGTEGRAGLAADALAQIPADQFSAVRLTAAPCLRLREFDYPVHRYYMQLRAGDDAAPPKRERTRLAISRREFVVKHYELSEFEHTLLSAILTGATLGAAISQAAATAPIEIESLAVRLQESFARWSAEGFFLSAEIA